MKVRYHGPVLFARRGPAFAPLAAIALAVSCTAPAPPRDTPVRPAAPKWPLLEAARAWPLAVPRHPSVGHAPPRYTLEVRVTPAASLPLYLDLVPGQSLPAGTQLAAFHQARTGEPGTIYAMEKLPDGTWRPLAADADGTLLQGNLTACLTCHRDAPADSVFGPPRTTVAPVAPP
jgi:hypothetical protein